ncbi:hypothetical protein VTO42DRAFT_1443 [Malbranchea cinnamomea]
MFRGQTYLRIWDQVASRLHEVSQLLDPQEQSSPWVVATAAMRRILRALLNAMASAPGPLEAEHREKPHSNDPALLISIDVGKSSQI